MNEKTGIIKNICISEKKGTPKQPVESAKFTENFGISGDAHAGNHHRQISILPSEEINAFCEKTGPVSPGAFGENLITEGIDLSGLTMGSTVNIGDDDPVILRLTQRGKQCHSDCVIKKNTGECIMPKKGIFAEVIKGGEVYPGDRIEVLSPPADAPFRAAVIVLSDKASRGEREDASGPAAVEILKKSGYEVLEYIVIPDEKELLRQELLRLSDGRDADLILTSGGTGFSVRDITPEVTMEVGERNAPGIAEYMRMRSFEVTDRAMLSRAASVIRGKSVIVNLPGSPSAVRECLGFIMEPLAHGIEILRGSASECSKETLNQRFHK